MLGARGESGPRFMGEAGLGSLELRGNSLQVGISLRTCLQAWKQRSFWSQVWGQLLSSSGSCPGLPSAALHF